MKSQEYYEEQKDKGKIKKANQVKLNVTFMDGLQPSM